MARPRCPHCGGDTVDIGYRIPVPPKKDVKRWLKLEADLALAKSAHAQTSQLLLVRRIHDLEKELSKLTALPENPGRRSLIRKLSSELERLHLR